jgi:hypothetical protein
LERLISDLRALPVAFRILLGGTAAERSAVRCPRLGRQVVDDIQSALDAV